MSIYNDVLTLQEMFAEYCVNIETGEIDETQEQQFASIRDEIIASGALKLCKVRANIANELDGVKTEINRLKERAESLNKQIERLNSFLLFLLKNNGGKKIDTGLFVVSNRQSAKVVLADDFYDDRFMKKKEVVTVDKMAVKDALKKGEVISGASLEICDNLQVN